METKDLKVEKKKPYSVYDIKLEVIQKSDSCCTFNSLIVDYRVACTSDTSLSEFINRIKANPIEDYSNHFLSGVSIHSVITIAKVDSDEYIIRDNHESSALYLLTINENFSSNCLIKCNCDLINYQSLI